MGLEEVEAEVEDEFELAIEGAFEVDDLLRGHLVLGVVEDLLAEEAEDLEAVFA